MRGEAKRDREAAQVVGEGDERESEPDGPDHLKGGWSQRHGEWHGGQYDRTAADARRGPTNVHCIHDPRLASQRRRCEAWVVYAVNVRWADQRAAWSTPSGAATG